MSGKTSPNKIPGSGTAACIHARSLDARGRVGPRCNAFRGSHARDDLMVTGDPGKVTCEKCQAGLS